MVSVNSVKWLTDGPDRLFTGALSDADSDSVCQQLRKLGVNAMVMRSFTLELVAEDGSDTPQPATIVPQTTEEAPLSVHVWDLQAFYNTFPNIQVEKTDNHPDVVAAKIEKAKTVDFKNRFGISYTPEVARTAFLSVSALAEEEGARNASHMQAEQKYILGLDEADIGYVLLDFLEMLNREEQSGRTGKIVKKTHQMLYEAAHKKKGIGNNPKSGM